MSIGGRGWDDWRGRRPRRAVRSQRGNVLTETAATDEHTAAQRAEAAPARLAAHLPETWSTPSLGAP